MTTIKYALLAGASYFDTRLPINRFPIPTGWKQISRYPQDDATGFEATAFGNGVDISHSTEIVISFAGTYDKDIAGDIAADLALAGGSLSAQLKQAADYYLEVKAANPSATISFTGHSLGGGLAALMAVMFGENATTFDQAPFLNSALTFTSTDPVTGETLPRSVAIDLRAYLVDHTSESFLAKLDAFIAASDPFNADPIQADTLASRSQQVSNINVEGEFLSNMPWNIPDRIGTTVLDIKNGTGVSGINLHSIALLTALLQSGDTATSTAADHTLGQATIKLPDLLKLLFDNNLYANDTDTDKQNFLERLVQHQAGTYDPAAGAVTLAPDQMVTRFTSDLWKLAQDGGLTLNDQDPGNPDAHFLSDALIAFTMQFYYPDTANALDPAKELFSTDGLSGGIRFDMKDVAASLVEAKGYNQYFKTYLEQYYTTATPDGFGGSTVSVSPEKDYILAALPQLRDWFVQAGASGMTATDTQNRGAFMLGGVAGDSLTGGDKIDLLVGNDVE